MLIMRLKIDVVFRKKKFAQKVHRRETQENGKNSNERLFFLLGIQHNTRIRSRVLKFERGVVKYKPQYSCNGTCTICNQSSIFDLVFPVNVGQAFFCCNHFLIHICRLWICLLCAHYFLSQLFITIKTRDDAVWSGCLVCDSRSRFIYQAPTCKQ